MGKQRPRNVKYLTQAFPAQGCDRQGLLNLGQDEGRKKKKEGKEKLLSKPQLCGPGCINPRGV
jgi:hypothetical protein